MVAISLYTAPRKISQSMETLRTPANLGEIDSSLTQSIDNYLIDFSRQYGQPFGYIQEQSGAIVQNLFPIRGNETEQISSSSQVYLEMHTETAFHPWKPDFLILYCVKGDRKAETTISMLSDILPRLSSDIINILQQERFVTSIDMSFQNSKQKNVQIRMPILSSDLSSMAFDQYLMRGIDEEAQSALDIFKEYVLKCLMGLTLSAGDILVIDNNRAIHGRTPFTPRHDGTDRWLKRVMVRKEPPPQSELDDSVITTIF